MYEVLHVCQNMLKLCTSNAFQQPNLNVFIEEV